MGVGGGSAILPPLLGLNREEREEREGLSFPYTCSYAYSYTIPPTPMKPQMTQVTPKGHRRPRHGGRRISASKRWSHGNHWSLTDQIEHIRTRLNTKKQQYLGDARKPLRAACLTEIGKASDFEGSGVFASRSAVTVRSVSRGESPGEPTRDPEAPLWFRLCRLRRHSVTYAPSLLNLIPQKRINHRDTEVTEGTSCRPGLHDPIPA